MTTQNTFSNEAGSIGGIIDSIMSAAASDQSRQGRLIEAMYNKADYQPGILVNIAKMQGAKRTEAINVLLKRESDTYGNLVTRLQTLNAKVRSNSNVVPERDAVYRKVVSAKQMFERAMNCLYYLYKAEAKNVIMSSRINGGVTFIGLDPEELGKPDNVPARATVSLREIEKVGKAMLNRDAGRVPTTATPTPANPAGVSNVNVLADGAKSLAASLKVLTKADPNGKLPKLDKAVEQDLMTIFRDVLGAKFIKANGKLDVVGLDAFWNGRDDRPVKEENKQEKAAAPVNNKAA